MRNTKRVFELLLLLVKRANLLGIVGFATTNAVIPVECDGVRRNVFVP